MKLISKPILLQEFSWSKEELSLMTTWKPEANLDILQLSSKNASMRLSAMLHQHKSKLKFVDKLPVFCRTPDVFMPPSLNLEQCSSELTAQFKAGLVQGKFFIDLSAGMGIDGYAFAEKFEHGLLVEKEMELSAVSAHNAACMGKFNLEFLGGITGEAYLQDFKGQCDLIYLDPDRRPGQSGRIFRLEDCEPQIITLLPKLFEHTQQVMIKCSPLLDIQSACSSLGQVKDVYVLAIKNECKELVFCLEKDFNGQATIHAIDLGEKSQHEIKFLIAEEKLLDIVPHEMQTFLYEPNAAILKAGAFKTVCSQYPVHKLHTNTHLYTSEKLVENFPGRRFEVIGLCKVDKKAFMQLLPNRKANLSIRNFPGTQADLKKKLQIQDGGDYYVFAFTDCYNQHQLVIAKKV